MEEKGSYRYFVNQIYLFQICSKISSRRKSAANIQQNIYVVSCWGLVASICKDYRLRRQL